MPEPELQNKQARLAEFLTRHALDGVYLQLRSNFAWITLGRDNHIANNSPVGVAGILATADSRICFTNTIEAPRFKLEELAGTGIEVVSYPWHDRKAARQTLKQLIAGRRIAADTSDTGDPDPFEAGFVKMPADFSGLRWQLTDAEIARFRAGGARAAAAVETACRLIRRGDSEHDVAGMIDEQIHRQGLNPVVTLVASDERIEKFRHPIPTAKKVDRYAMLVSCASYGGLISNLTRIVSFVPLTADLKARHQAVCNVDAAVNLHTRPGRTLGDMFRFLERAYADNGHPGQCSHHHQGGSTGYAAREVFATPDSTLPILENQAYAWNPTLPGVKSEDTIICTAAGVEVLTGSSKDWPRLPAHYQQYALDRPDILVRQD